MTQTPRIAPLTVAERTERQREMIEQIGSEFHIFTTFARHPELFGVYERFAGRLLYRSSLTAHERETLILRTAYRCRCGYEWVHHVEIAEREGMARDVIDAIGTDDAAGVDPLLVAAADQLVADHDLDDATWAGLRDRFDERQVIEVCMLVGNYAMTAGVLTALRVQPEDGYAAPEW